MHLQARSTRSDAAAHGRSPPRAGSRRRAVRRLLLAGALAGTLLPRAAAGQVEKFADVPGPTGLLVNDQGDVVVVAAQPPTIVRFSADGSRAAETALPEDRGRSRLAWGAPAFNGVVLLSPAGTLDVSLLDQNAPPGVVFELGATQNPVTVQAPDLDASNAPVTISLAGARFDDVAPGPPSVAASGASTPIDLFVTGATAVDAQGNGGQPFVIRVRVDVAARQAQMAGIATTQGPPTQPPFPSGVGVTWLNTNGAITGATIAASLPTKTHARPGEAGNVIVTIGGGFPEDTSPEAAPKVLLDDQGQPIAYAASGMGTDGAGNLYMVVAVGACASGPGPGVLVFTSTQTLCASLPDTTASGGSDVAVGKAGDPVFVTDEQGNQVLRIPPPPITTTPSMPPSPMAAAAEWGRARVSGAGVR